MCLAVDPVFPGGHDLVEIPVNMKILFVQAPAAHEASPMEVELKRAIHNAQQLGVGVSLSLILGGRQFDFDDLAVDIGGGMAAAEERVEGRVARAARVEEGWEAVVATVARLEARVEAAEADARAAEAAAVRAMDAAVEAKAVAEAALADARMAADAAVEGARMRSDAAVAAEARAAAWLGRVAAADAAVSAAAGRTEVEVRLRVAAEARVAAWETVAEARRFGWGTTSGVDGA